jgi:hypothetical protein
MLGAPHLEVPGTIFIIIGLAFIVFRLQISAGFNALSASIFAKREEKGDPKVTMKPSMSVALGIAWILSGVIMLFVV